MTTRFFKLTLLIICVGTLLLLISLRDQPTFDLNQANKLYNENRFEESAGIYVREIVKGRVNGHLYYNLGNSYFRMGALAGAIHYYFKAQNLLPRNEDVQANLAYALRQTESQLGERKSLALESILFWVPDFNLKEHVVALLSINLIFWITLAIGLHSDTQATQSARNFLLALLILASVSTVFRWQLESLPPPEVTIPRSIMEQWLVIKSPDGTKSWVSKSEVLENSKTSGKNPNDDPLQPLQ